MFQWQFVRQFNLKSSCQDQIYGKIKIQNICKFYIKMVKIDNYLFYNPNSNLFRIARC